MIQVEGLTKYYGNFKALDSISFHTGEGEIVGFLGPNGAGKTTTMRILTAYMPPSEGRAVVAGYDVFEQSLAVRQNVGYMPETVPLYKELTVWQYVDYMAALRGVHNPHRGRRVRQVLEQVAMYDRRNSIIDSLSKGMRQRVGLAQALVHDPKVLILDEPTIGLDPRQVREARDLIRSLGQDRTVLLSTHILSEVSQLCTRILVINKGQIVAEDSPDTLATRLQGTRRLFVGVGSAKLEEVAKAIQKLKGVIEAHPAEKGVEITTKGDVDLRQEITSLIFSKSWELLELRSIDMSLEDIFLQLTNEEGEEEDRKSTRLNS